jgi:hypothetical protein
MSDLRRNPFGLPHPLAVQLGDAPLAKEYVY